MKKRHLPIILLFLGLVVFILAGGPKHMNLQSLADHRDILAGYVEAYGPLAVLGFMAFYATAVSLSVPGGVVLTIASGFLFGPVLGPLYSVTSATLGATVVFFAARSAFRPYFREKAGKSLQKLERGFQENAISYMIFLRLVPVFPFWLINIVPALLGISPRLYILATFFGIMPGTFVYASIGNGLGALLEAGQNPDLGLIFEPEILTPLIGIALLSLIPVLYKRFRKKAPGYETRYPEM